MKTIVKNILILAFISGMLQACKDDVEPSKVNPLEGLTLLNEGYAVGASAKVQLWGAQNYFMGYNNLTVVLLDSASNDTIKEAHIHFKPVMTMGMGSSTMQHACPIENPDENAMNGVFRGAIAFVMPSGTNDTWKLGLDVHNHEADKEGSIDFSITVGNPSTSVMSVFTASDNSKLVLSMLQPLNPKVGLNDIEFTLHRKESMMSWPADSTYTLEISPEMPSMGHGSPNNVNPVHTGNGHYKGKVNFTMTGEWQINVTVKKNGTAVSNGLYFNVKL